MMLVMMPLLFGFLTLSYPSGLALYWVISNIIGIIMQYFVTGWGGLDTLWFTKKSSNTGKPSKPSLEPKVLPPPK
jgi:hypothetical protein